MTWKTHAAIGANSIWLVPFFSTVDQTMLMYLIVAVVASLLPDIDAVTAKIHYIGGGALGIFRGMFRGKLFHHRGMMHSVFVALLFSMIIWIFSRHTYPMLGAVFFVAYLSHSVIDGFNTSVGFLYPFIPKRFALVPKPLQSHVGGLTDNLFLFIGLLGLLLFFMTFRDQLLLNNLSTLPKY